MPDQPHLNGTAFLAHERMGDLRLTALEIHGLPKPQGAPDQPGRIDRMRATLGRRLMSLGSTLAGHHA